MDREAAIIEPPSPAQRRADHKDRVELSARRHEPVYLARHRVEHRILKQQIVDRISREAQLREDQQRDTGLVALHHEIQHLVAVLRRLGHRHLRHAGADPDELMAIGREKLGHRVGSYAGIRFHP